MAARWILFARNSLGENLITNRIFITLLQSFDASSRQKRKVDGFERMAQHLPAEGHWDWVGGLYEEWQSLPGLFDDERQALRDKLASLEAD
jgi:hypothetical protein